MEGELFAALYQIVHELAPRRGKRQQHSDAVIVLIYLWSVLMDRPRRWACDPRNAPPGWDQPVPSDACLSRRMHSASVQNLMQRLVQQVQWRMHGAMLLLLIDSKPLIVGAYSKDRHAKWGHLADGKKARGYRVHLVTTNDGQVAAWTVASMNEADCVVAQRLVPQLRSQGYLVGDSAYDSNPLHTLCARQGLRLIAPRKKPGTGLGKQSHHEARRQSIALLESPGACASAFGRDLYHQRAHIERVFGRWCSMAAGLNLSLPAWVRTPRRVTDWIAGKLTLFLLYITAFSPE